MDRRDFWSLIEEARTSVAAGIPDGPVGSEEEASATAERAAGILAGRPPADIVAAAQPLWDLMADSYRGDLWAAAYLINGGASDDGFDYFRGWLIAQGQAMFERAIADPDGLSDHPGVQRAAAGGTELECEDVLGIVWSAHQAATGE